jgi:Flp pilus assembly protein TadG
MRWSRRWTDRAGSQLSGRDDRGSASLEFIVAGLLLLVPLVYLVLAVSAVQAASLAVEGAARQASRVFVQAGSIAEANAAAGRAIEVTLADYGLDASEATVTITCRPNPTACLTRRGFVTVGVEVRVPLPLAPPVLEVDVPAGVPVQSASTEQVSRFAGAR